MAKRGTSCTICGATLPAGTTCRDLFHEVSYYTLAHPDPVFLHQYAVDAYAAQHAAENKKSIATTAGLIGLYLFVVRGYTGTEVQRAHVKLGSTMKQWPRFAPPAERAALTVADVSAAAPGAERDERIRAWARAVWDIWKGERRKIETLLA